MAHVFFIASWISHIVRLINIIYRQELTWEWIGPEWIWCLQAPSLRRPEVWRLSAGREWIACWSSVQVGRWKKKFFQRSQGNYMMSIKSQKWYQVFIPYFVCRNVCLSIQCILPFPTIPPLLFIKRKTRLNLSFGKHWWTTHRTPSRKATTMLPFNILLLSYWVLRQSFQSQHSL